MRDIAGKNIKINWPRRAAKKLLRPCDFEALGVHHKMAVVATQRRSKIIPANFFAAVEVRSASFDF
jgi:hypothetical protein